MKTWSLRIWILLATGWMLCTTSCFTIKGGKVTPASLVGKWVSDSQIIMDPIAGQSIYRYELEMVNTPEGVQLLGEPQMVILQYSPLAKLLSSLLYPFIQLSQPSSLGASSNIESVTHEWNAKHALVYTITYHHNDESWASVWSIQFRNSQYGRIYLDNGTSIWLYKQ